MDNILEKIYKAGLKFLMPLTPDETFATIINEAMKLTDADFGSIFLEKDGELERVYASSPLLYNIQVRKKGYTYNVFKTHKPIVLSSKQIAEIHPEIKDTHTHTDLIVPLFNNNKTVGVLTVMSQKKESFEKADLSLLNLFAPLASLAIRKTQLYDETRQALEIRDLFISMAAHELRTPLTSVNGYIQLLYGKLSKTGGVESKWVEQLHGESVRLTNLVNELLTINRIKTGKLQYLWKECSLKDVILRAISEFNFTNSHRKLVFENNLRSGSDLVIGDYDKLLQVLNNLLDNAAKFSPENTEIIISLSYKNPNFIVSIRDYGKGIKRSEVAKISEQYFRGSNHDKEGMGFGMYLVKNIVKEHHGLMAIRSKPKTGTTVEITLPKTKYE